MKKRVYIALAATLTAAGVSAQQTRLLTADKHNEYGIVYNLPLTQLVFDIEAEHTVSVAGPFYRYAGKYVGTADVVKSDSESWDVKSVSLSTRGVPGGPSRSYLMQLKSGQDVSVCVAGEGDGMLLAINKDVALPASPALPSGADSDPLLARTEAEEAAKAYLQYVDEDFLVSQSSAMRARMLSETLMTVRESKLSLSRGTAETMPADGRQLELMLNSLGAQEKALAEAFTGVVVRRSATHRYTFTPDTTATAADGSRMVLGRLSDFSGFTDADDLSGEPIYISLRYISTPELPVDEKGEPKRLPKDAVVYTLPSTAEVTLTWMGRTIYSGNVDLAQQGTVFGLDPKLFTDRKAPSEAEFDPSTGALLRIARKEQ